MENEPHNKQFAYFDEASGMRIANDETKELREQIRVLTEALGHYADEQHWTSRTGKTDGTVKDWYWGNHGSDNGYDIAQKALKGE
jgi:hypothetical protein